MHTDENKIFDKRNIERNIKDGRITREAYLNYLSKLPDISDKLFNPDDLSCSEEIELIEGHEIKNKKKASKKKIK